jgi:hypothetical protein
MVLLRWTGRSRKLMDVRCCVSTVTFILVLHLLKSAEVSTILFCIDCKLWKCYPRLLNIHLLRVSQQEIRGKLNSGYACNHSLQKYLPPPILSKNITIRTYEIIILSLVLYGRETLPLILREEHRLRAFENKVLRRIFGPKRNWVKGGWRKLHNEEHSS